MLTCIIIKASELRLTLVSVLQMKLCQLLIADVSFIAQEKKDLLGIIITHAHEDHCDASLPGGEEFAAALALTMTFMRFLVTAK
ncbi:Uncharacterized protein BM_BM17235 [Brugia malayi]|uniref:Metallo-beta-lactamase domain-containing protein n=1 Tax=Brugia malayi TaxID=6279 RepID=A0A4E9G0V0_BRUMA|nr:Uncharacterized protein BM_BM17235 [Brugia malayi]VIP00407.1 Uncharacterized protein BM_BM17235 [Brugia malayi]